MPKPKKPAVATDLENPPARFFEKQLAGEEPPSFETMNQLYENSMRFFEFAPWEFFSDRQLVLLEDPVSKETCYCLILGALGQVFALQAYIGTESYRLHKRIQAQEQLTSENFFSILRGLGVEFEIPSALTPPDKQLLRSLGNPLKRGARVPVFRSYRPGYQPWYITEPEAVTLAACVEAANAMFLEFLKHKDFSYWGEPDLYPFMVPRNDEKRSYEVRKVKVPYPPAPALVPAAVDQARVRKIHEKDYVLKGAFEADHFWSGMVVGEKNARKAFTQMAFVSDAISYFAFPPEVGEPGQPAGEMLANAVLKAIEIAGYLPAELKVRNNETKTLLAPLAKHLGITLRVSKSLPAIEDLRSHFLQFLGR